LSKEKPRVSKKRKPISFAYAVKSDDGEKPKNQFLAYAVKSDNG